MRTVLGMWRALRARVLNLDPGNPWRVLWLAMNGALGTWGVAGLFPEWPLLAALTCALFLLISGLELFLMNKLADRLEQRCIFAETRARAAEARAERAEKSVRVGPIRVYSTRN